MATSAPTEAKGEHDDHGHGEEHHGPWYLAHHFDTPEQQFDSGKLGMWLFLVQEVLFFSGLFCAYAYYRSLHPEVFEYCSQFLNTKLGAINTGVLLFSSLTMAWGVRAAQLKQHKLLVGLLAATLGCAMIFLGVKAIEYSHKWDIGLLPPAWYSYDPTAPHGDGGMQYVYRLSLIPALLLVGMIGYFAVAKFVWKSPFHTKVAMPLIVVAACYFVGVGLGMVLESGSKEGHVAAHAAHGAGHQGDHAHSTSGHADAGHAAASHDAASHDAASQRPGVVDERSAALSRLANDKLNTGAMQELRVAEQLEKLDGGPVQPRKDSAAEEPKGESFKVNAVDVNTPGLAGVFFAIYYCITGLHAIHIIGGIVVLTWLLVRAVREEFESQYFGPVDYVGLYWHLVDLIWIYLFPLLYLIG
jgi:cytochrome c oxidase subunit III